MAVEIRALGDDELEAFWFLVAYSFDADRSPEGRERMGHLEEMRQPLALFEDGQMIACLGVMPLAMRLGGASIPLAGVTSVACLPEQRRKGYVGQLLRFALEKVRSEGYPLSSLYTPHPALYRRYGWMIAANVLAHKFHPKDIGAAAALEPSGRAERLSEEDWPRLEALYRRFVQGRNGYLERSERWWRECVLRGIYDPRRHPLDAAVWVNGRGEDSGYILYRSQRLDPRGLSTHLSVRDFVSLDGEAYVGLLRYLVSHDLASEVQWRTAVDDPLLAAVDEPWRLQTEADYGFMLRIVDVEAAFAQRPLAPGVPEGAFTLQVADAAAPWNQGAWRLEARAGRLRAERAKGAADLATDAATLAALYDGYLKPSEAARAGLLAAESAEALSLADRMLAVEYAPYCPDFF